jgi:exopolysaccharide biosynthesis polyprenyl glycosylphosphotransferase
MALPARGFQVFLVQPVTHPGVQEGGNALTLMANGPLGGRSALGSGTTPDQPALEPASFQAPTSAWRTAFVRATIVTDVAVLVLAGVLAQLAPASGPIGNMGYATVLGIAWWGFLSFGRAHESRFLGDGPEEFRRVANASLRLGFTVTFLAYTFRLPIHRVFLAVFLALGTTLLLIGRYGLRVARQFGRRRGRFMQKVVLAGSYQHVRELARQMRADRLTGLTVVGVCLPDVSLARFDLGADETVPVVGSLDTIPGAVSMTGANAVAIATAPEMTGEALRHLSYELEGTGVDLLVAPALTNVTGNRVSLRPMGGVPLLHVDEPELTGARKLVKAVFDRTVALLALVVLTPLLLVLAVIVRTTSAGPAFFRQERIGRDGEPFRVWKLRTMGVDAESQRSALLALNELDGPLFKMRNDPRVTRVGAFLRKYSLDELPQLINVVRGDMSLVGPRPPLASEVAQYVGHAHRRLLVKPGITGLWQVSGRSDLDWAETVRLDLRYVEDWSLGLDLVLLARTILSVLKGRGAY